MNTFTYSITGVPDLDQEWHGLPNCGKTYCVPTSTMNWMYYMAKHGRPGALMFQDTDTSNAFVVTMNITWMGAYMDTDPHDGTSGDDGVDGLCDWIDDFNIPSVIFAESAIDCGDITFGDLEAWTAINGMTVVIRGQYSKSGDEFERTSGHAMSMIGLDKSGRSATISVHNPADDNSNLDTQSAKIKQTETLTSEKRNLEGDEANVLRWGTDTNPYWFIDGLMTIVPLFVLTNPTAKTVTKHTSSASGASFDSQEYKLPFDGELLDIAIHPFLPTASFIGRGSSDVWSLDFRDGSWTKTVNVPSPERVTFGGRDRRLFVASSREIFGFDKAGKPIGRVAIGEPIDAISYDAKNDRLIVAPSSAKRLVAVSPALKILGDTQAPEVPGTGRLALSVNGRDGTIVLSRAGSASVGTLRWHATGAIASGRFHLLAEQPAAVHVDRRGKLYESEGGKIAVFDIDGNRTKSLVDGLAAGPILKVARSSHNFDPIRSRRKAWKNGQANAVRGPQT